MGIVDFDEDQRIEEERFNNKLYGIINDLRLTLSNLENKKGNDIQPEFSKGFNYAIKYIEEAYID